MNNLFLKLISKCLQLGRVSSAIIFVIAAFSFASGQVEEKTQESAINQAMLEAEQTGDANKTVTPSVVAAESPISIHLVGGRRIQVAEVTENSDGVWFRIGNVTTLIDRKRVERIDRESNPKQNTTTEPLRGAGNWKLSDSAKVESYFLSRFGRRLPLTAFGQSPLHTRWGYDHREGMDVGLHPHSREGRELIQFLRTQEIPFLAFHETVPGVATGPHIHVGNPSRRLAIR